MLDTNIISDLMRDPKGQSDQRRQHLMQDLPDLKVCTRLVVDCEANFGLLRKLSKLLQHAYTDFLQVIEIMPLDLPVSSHHACICTPLERLGTNWTTSP